MEQLHISRDDVRDLPDWWVQRAEAFWAVKHGIEESKQKAAEAKSGKRRKPRRTPGR